MYIEALKNSLNSYHEKLQFTYEVEIEKQMPFLDIIIKYDDNNKFCTDWYQKPLSSDRLLNYHSYHHHRYKINTAKEFIHRVLELSDRCFWPLNTQKIQRILLKNNYPKELIQKLIEERTRNKNIIITVTRPPEDKEVSYCSLQYVHGLSENLGCMVKKYLPNVVVAMKSIVSMNEVYSKTKDKIPMLDQSGVVYEIPCHQCNAVYIGQTGRNLRTRISEHKVDEGKIILNNLNVQTPLRTTNNANTRISPRASSPLPSPNTPRDNKSALVHHVQNDRHKFNFDGVKIINKHTHTKKRLFLEAYEIKNNQHSCNLRTDIDKLSIIYSAILNSRGNS